MTVVSEMVTCLPTWSYSTEHVGKIKTSNFELSLSQLPTPHSEVATFASCVYRLPDILMVAGQGQALVTNQFYGFLSRLYTCTN